jgi:hypothetical protein
MLLVRNLLLAGLWVLLLLLSEGAREKTSP